MKSDLAVKAKCLIFKSFRARAAIFALALPLHHYLCASPLSATTLWRPSILSAHITNGRPADNRNPNLRVSAVSYGWQPLSTTGPDGTIYSIMRTANPLRSDPDFAGMIVRCSSKLRFQVGFVLIVPFPPRAKPKITISFSNGEVQQFTGDLLPPGTIVLIAAGAEHLARTLATSSGDISILIKENQTLHGSVALDDIGTAISSLRNSCL